MSLSTPLFLIINSTTPLVLATTPSGVNVTRLGDANL
jgi:hypothetical protein